MPFVGSIIPSRLINADQQARRVKRDKDIERAKYPGEAKRGADDADLTTARIEQIDPLRQTSANEEEASHEDRQEHGFYDSRNPPSPHNPPRIDIEG
jgi:hypothetical protein